MAAKKAIESNDLKNRIENFHREAHYQEKPYRFLGKPQIINKQVSILIAYPADDEGLNKAAFAETVSSQLKEYGLDPAKVAVQKQAVRIQARLLVTAPEKPADEA
jgi:hypothetical protein